MLALTVLYENHPHPRKTQLETGHGFSVFLEFNGKKILFDCGWDGNLLLRNANRLGIDLSHLDAVIISHGHWDHAGGLPILLNHTDNPDIYIPDDYSTSQPKEYGRYLSDPYVQRTSDFTVFSRISPDLASTGCYKEQGPIGEQALLVKYGSQNETLLLVGCLHPGLQVFLQHAQPFGNVDKLMGGIHGFKDAAYLSSTPLSDLYLGHCTRNYETFEDLKKIQMERIYVGYSITLGT